MDQSQVAFTTTHYLSLRPLHTRNLSLTVSRVVGEYEHQPPEWAHLAPQERGNLKKLPIMLPFPTFYVPEVNTFIPSDRYGANFLPFAVLLTTAKA
jgi:hypothetical protein